MIKKFISFLGVENPWGSWEVFEIYKDPANNFFSVEIKRKKNSGEFKFRERLLTSIPLDLTEEEFKYRVHGNK